MTQSDIARAAGVHNTTVSLALRDRACIPEATRRKIQTIARRMGYTPDPALQALVAYRKSVVGAGAHSTIAFVTDTTGADCPGELQARELCLLGARDAAVKLGYTLEHFWLETHEIAEGRLGQLLAGRGIHAALLAWHRGGTSRPLDFDCRELCAVRVGNAGWNPSLHSVVNDVGANVRLGFRHARQAGYRRIGLVLPSGWDEASDGVWSLAFAVEQARLPQQDQIPPLTLSGDASNHASDSHGSPPESRAEALDRWLDACRPEVILASKPHVSAALSRLGRRIPDDLALIELQNEKPDATLAGVRQNYVSVGALSVETVVRLLQQNQRGLPSVPTVTLVQGTWCDGASLPFLANGGRQVSETMANGTLKLATTAA